MGKFIDLTGNKYGRLTVIRNTGQKKWGSYIYECLCECGNICEVVSSNLTRGGTKSCGCLKKESDRAPKGNVIDLIGQKFGHLTVVNRAGSDNRGEATWECKCDCGNPQHLIVLGSNLRNGHTQSCGCERRSHGELAIESLLYNNNIPFVQEYRAFKFASGNWAKFDFYVDNSYIIEYDGETHYLYNMHGWHNEEQLKAQQERDIIKSQWCKDNNIPLIRIPYTRLKDLCLDDLKLETSLFIVS